MAWSVQEQTGGTITSSGAYTAPKVAGTYHITAVSQADSTKSAIAIVTVTAPVPTVTSTPPTTASQGVQYSYALTATDPAQSAISYALTTAPTGATLSGSTVLWTPTPAQARTANTFTVAVTTAAGGSASQSWQVTPNGTITGTRIIEYVTDSGSVSVPDDTTSFTIEALVPNGTGGYTTIPGTGSKSGTYSIPGVPAGFFWLHHGVSYFWTNASQIDSGYSTLGSQSLTRASAGTQIQVSASNLTPINNSDLFEGYIANTRDLEFGTPSGGSIGTTSSNLTFVPFYLPQLSDSAYVSQLSASPVNSQVLVASSFCGPANLSVSDGFINTAFCPFAPITPTLTVHVAVALSQFAQLQAGVNPNAAAYFSTYFVDASTPDLVTNAQNLGTTDIDLGDIAFGNPYPSAWGLFGGFQAQYNLTYTLPNTSLSTTVYAGNETEPTTPVTAAAPLRPLIGTVQTPTVNGNSFFSNQSSVGTTPKVQWSAPSLGIANGYVISIHLLSPNGSQLTDQTVSTLYTTATTVNVPPGIMTTGNWYYLKINALSNGSVDINSTPFRKAFPYGRTQTLSGLVTP